MAPMVEHSELAFRMLGRKYGTQLCYTPMLHAASFLAQERYREQHFTTCPEDRPLVVQFCANDPDVLLAAAKLVEAHCDAVDLNLGCPQNIAKAGRYGAFLQEDWPLLRRLVGALHHGLTVPVTCKIRVLDDAESTIQYARMLQEAGCQLLTVHGRRRHQKGHATGLADWDIIRAVKAAVDIPVLANGNVLYSADVERCLEQTGVDGVMAAEGLLYNPALFSGQLLPVWEVAEEYLRLCRQYPPPLPWTRAHLFKLWHHALPRRPDLRQRLADALTLSDIEAIAGDLRATFDPLHQQDGPPASQNVVAKTQVPFWLCQPFVRPLPPSLSEADVLAAIRLAQNSSADPVVGDLAEWIGKGLTERGTKRPADDPESDAAAPPQKQAKTAAEKKAERMQAHAFRMCENIKASGEACKSIAKAACVSRHCKECCRLVNALCRPHRHFHAKALDTAPADAAPTEREPAPATDPPLPTE